MNDCCACGRPGGPLDIPLRGSYCPQCARFDEASFIKEWHPVYFLVFGFIHRFMRRNLDHSQTDYLSNKIASEIWLYNLGQTLQQHRYADIAEALEDDRRRPDVLAKCNAYSLAQYLGVPHETVRRKVLALIERGWVVRAADGSLSISAACEAEFKPEFIIETMRDFVSTARGTLAMLEAAANAEADPGKQP